MSDPSLSISEHQEQASKHRGLGYGLLKQNQDWGAVCLFYSAYHHMLAAFLADPVFDDPTRCHAINPNLTIDDRFASSHNARKGAGGKRGVNDLCALLYPQVIGDYERLHHFSVLVRYGKGLTEEQRSLAIQKDEAFQRSLAAGKLCVDPERYMLR